MVPIGSHLRDPSIFLSVGEESDSIERSICRSQSGEIFRAKVHHDKSIVTDVI